MTKLVYDIGMHIGQDTKYYLEEGYNVLAIEANPILVKKAKIKFAKFIAAKQLTILNVGIAESEGRRLFYKNLRRSEWSSFDKSIGSRNGTQYEVIEVQCITTKKLFNDYGLPYYMKVDIEGYDYLCLSDIPDQGEKPQFVSCEADSLEWLNIMRSKGYSKFKLISQGGDFSPINLNKERNFYYNKYQLIKNIVKLRLQRVLPFKHMIGSSGPFGEKSLGEWKTYDEVKELYEAFYSNKSGKALNDYSWFDFHATF